MTLKEKIIELTAEDGPNIPLRTIALYCGTSQPTLTLYIQGKRQISQQLEAQIEKGLREYTQLMWDIAHN